MKKFERYYLAKKREKKLLCLFLREKEILKRTNQFKYPTDFLDYEGTELLLIPKKKEGLVQREKEVATCLAEVPFDNLLSEFARTISPETIAPIEE
jgi:hypothetical protein